MFKFKDFSKSSFQNLLKCLLPLSHKIVTILEFLGNILDNLTLATKLQQDYEPKNKPSDFMMNLDIAIASSSVTLKASSINS